MEKKLLAIMLTVMLILHGALYAFGASQPEEAHWVDIVTSREEETYCFGANAGGTRFLMGSYGDATEMGRPLHMHITDISGDERTELYFSDFADVGATISRVAFPYMEDDAFAALIQDTEAKQAFALQYVWMMKAAFVETRGDLMLLLSGMNEQILVDASTGEVTPLGSTAASLTEDGRVLCYQEEQGYIYDPRDGARFPLISMTRARTLAARSLATGETVFLRHGEMNNMEVDSFVDIGWEVGGIRETIHCGTLRFGSQYNQTLYSGELGIGIVYNNAYAMVNPPRIFHKGSGDAKVLWLDSLDATHVTEVEPSQVLDAEGWLSVTADCLLLPCGISQDGRGMLLMEINSASLLQMDLDTLAVRRVLTFEAVEALFEQKSLPHTGASTMSLLGWNGGNLLIGGLMAPPNSVLWIPVQ